jgi:exodeoxyribonuclease V alpha subunit
LTIAQTLRVVTVRKQNPRGFGGAIFTAKPIDLAGNVVDASTYVVVRASGVVLSGAVVEQGQWWQVSGELSSRVVDVNGYRITENQIEAASAGMVRPSGEHIVTFIAESTAFEGIGLVKARRLWDTFGEDLFDVLDRRDVDALCKVLSKDLAVKALDAWAMHGDARSLQWLHSQGFDVTLGRKVIAFFGADTPDKIEEDPYRLLSFCASWKQVDGLARTHFAVPLDDPRRLQGAIEEACYRLFASGHTAALSSSLMDSMAPLLGQKTAPFKWRPLVSAALSSGLNNGSFVVGHHGIQPLGALVMEATVASAIAQRMAMSSSSQLLSTATVDEAISDYEAVEDIALNAEQRRAVHVAAAESFACITGGAGVGKTTVLKALYAVYERAGVKVVQVALAGRAAKRMQEATGRPASTIASFLRGHKDGDLAQPTVLVVDEASMVDIITMH